MPIDVHPPTKPLRSVRDFAFHLFTITCGILIALALESVVQRFHHRHAANEAKANLLREVADNRSGMLHGAEMRRGTLKQLESILATVRALEADRNAKHGELDLNVGISSLSTTAWSTASATGALAYMDTADVERFTDVYDLQQQFMNAQQRSLDALLELESWGALTGAPLARVSDAQAVEAERAAGRALAATRTAQDLGESLTKKYGKALAVK